MEILTRVVVFVVAAKGPPVQRKPLKHRDYQVDLESRLGKTQVSVLYFSSRDDIWCLFHINLCNCSQTCVDDAKWTVEVHFHLLSA